MSDYTKGILGKGFTDPSQFKEDPPRPDHGNILFDISLSRAHFGTRRFMGNRLIRKDADPDFSRSFCMVAEDTTGGFDLTRGYPADPQTFNSEISEIDIGGV